MNMHLKPTIFYVPPSITDESSCEEIYCWDCLSKRGLNFSPETGLKILMGRSENELYGVFLDSSCRWWNELQRRKHIGSEWMQRFLQSLFAANFFEEALSEF